MALSCSIIPQVKNKNGEIVDSKLFKDIMSLTNKREAILDIYERVTSSFFLTDNRDILQFDENNEPTLKSIMAHFDISSQLGDNVEAILLKNMKEDGVTYENTAENVRILSEKASSFNNTSEYSDKFVALPVLNSDGKLQMSIKEATTENKIEAERMSANMMLNDRIKSILAEHGLNIGALDTLEESISAAGIVDFSVAPNAGKGIANIIRLSKGIRGEQALPEEYAHFVIEAMSDDVFIKRSLTALNNNPDLVRAILNKDYESYASEYNDEQLTREALGKLLSIHLLNSVSTDGVSIKTLLDRTINSIKSRFSKINDERIMDAINDINKSMQYIADKVVKNDVKFNLDNIKVSDTLKQIDRQKQALKKILEVELKRNKIYIERNNKKETKESAKRKENFKNKQTKLINELSKKIKADQTNEAYLFYLEHVINNVSILKTRLEEALSSTMTLEEKAHITRHIQDYLASYAIVLNDLTELAAEPDTTVSPEVDHLIGEALKVVKKLSSTNIGISIELFASALGEELTENTRDSSGNLISEDDLIELLKKSDKDISTSALWVSSTANMNDIILKLVDKKLKDRHERARRRVIKLINELNVVDKGLKNAGINDYEFMYQKNPDGTYSHHYVSEINYALYDYNKKQLYDRLNQEYGTQPVGKAAGKKQTEIKKWYKKNFNYKTNKPNEEIYGVTVKFDHPAQEEYYKKFKEIRKNMIELLPTDVYLDHPEQVIQIRKDFLDRLKNTPREGWGELISQQVKDMFQRRETDPSSLVSYGFKDFEGREIMALPIFFVERLEDGKKDVSRDATSSLIAFANMAVEYDELSKINDILEMGRNVAQNRKFSKKRFGKPLMELFETLGYKVQSDIDETESSNFLNAYNELLESQLYGRYAKEGDDILDGKVNTKKVSNTLNRLSSLNQLAFNLLAGIAAVGTDSINLAVEADGGRNFTRKNLFNADKIYFKELIGHLSEAGDHNKNNKLSLFIREFDLLHEYENDVRNGEYNKSRLTKLLKNNLLYIFMNLGSHFGEVRVSLAVADTIKLKDKHKNIINLWDAYEVVPNDPSNESLGSYLRLKEGVTKEDGSEVDEQFLTDYKNKSWAINHRLFGIYNKADINKAQKTAIGAMVMLYRKHIMPAIQRRFGAYQYDAMLDQDVEGYYTTGLKLMRKMINDYKDVRDLSVFSWDNLSDMEKSQLRQLRSEAIHIGALIALVMITSGLKWADKDNPYAMRMFAYQAKRIRMESMAFTPIGLPKELWQVLDSPAASINTIESIVDLLDLFYPPNYFNEMQTGRFKGHSRAYKTFMKSPLLPMNNTIYRSLHPEETIQFFNN